MKNEFDNKLTDKGWSRMQHLLNREMPVQRRRRFVWWPWLLLLLLGSGAGGWWLSQKAAADQPATEPAIRPKTAEPVVAAPAASTGGIRPANTAPSATAAQAPQAGVKTQQTTQPSISAKGLTENRMATPATTPLQTTEKQGFSLQKPVVRNSIGTSELKPVPVSSSDASGIAEAPVTILPESPLATATIAQKMLSLTALPPANVLIGPKSQATVLRKVDAPLTTTTVKPAPQLKRWSFGASAGISSGDFTALNSFSVGALTEFRLSRRWGLRGGLQFAQYNLSAGERPVVSVDAQEYNKATGNDVQDVNIGLPSSVSQTTVYVPLERTKRLEIPILAYWQPLGGLRMLGGISAGYLLSTRASEMNYANNQLYLAADQDALSNLSALTARSTSRWNLDWQLGLGWRFGKHFELNAFYKHQFNMNAVKAEGQFDPNGFGTNAVGDNAGTTNYTTPSFQLHGIWFF